MNTLESLKYEAFSRVEKSLRRGELQKSSRRCDFSVFKDLTYPEAYALAKTRHERRVLACVHYSLHNGYFPWRHPEAIEKLWLEPTPSPTVGELRWSGGRRAVLEAIGDGALERECGVWTGDFWAGLVDSGVVWRREANGGEWQWRGNFRHARELLGDMEGAKEVRVDVSPREDRWGRRGIRSMSSLLPEPAEANARWFAGMLAGMSLVERMGLWTLESRRPTERGMRFLSESGVWFTGAVGGGIWISPFYLPLVGHISPVGVGGRWEAIRGLRRARIYGGQWLPYATWEVVFGKGFGGVWPDRPWGLPWAPNHATRARDGVDRKRAHQEALARGCGYPAGWLKGLCVEWREREYGKEEKEERQG